MDYACCRASRGIAWRGLDWKRQQLSRPEAVITRFHRKTSLVARRTGDSVDGTALSLVARQADDPVDGTVLGLVTWRAGDPVDGTALSLVAR